nr:DUF393 domain-containing protein [Acidobacteriota bacterium]
MAATLTSAVLVYDGECDFCRSCVRFLQRRTSRPLTAVAFQSADLPALGLRRADCEAAVQWVSAKGAVSSAHVAVASALRHARAPWSLAGWLIALPVIRQIAAVVYRRVAARRTCAAPTPPVG